MMPLMASVPPLLARAVQVGQELLPSDGQGAAEPGNLGDRAAMERLDDRQGDLLPSTSDVAANADRRRW
jgi:hypothetical protein